MSQENEVLRQAEGLRIEIKHRRKTKGEHREAGWQERGALLRGLAYLVGTEPTGEQSTGGC